jgi:uncharacterized glyoxalase superfamily protein PhnB
MTADIRPNIFPALRYNDARAAIDWLTRAFGFEKDVEHAAPDGSIAHAQLHLGPGVVGLGSAHNTPSEHPWAQVRQGIYVHVDEVDAHHDRAKQAGAEIVMPLRDMEYGSREYSVRDPEGHLWGFGTYDMAGKHTGEPNLFVELYCRDVRATTEWTARALGFEKTFDVPAPGGGVLHAEMRFGPGTIMLGRGPQDPGLSGISHGLYFYLPDPDAHFARSKAAGARIIRAPETTSFGARAYYACDPEGFLWGFSTYRPQPASV